MKAHSTGCGSDVIIRQKTKGKKSLDDFCHLFHGAPSTGPALKTYTFDDVVNALNQVVPYDWRGFWTERLTNHGPGAPLGGIEGSGWKVTYDETPSEMLRARRNVSLRAGRISLGSTCAKMAASPTRLKVKLAAKAGIGPGMKVVAVNGRQVLRRNSPRRDQGREERQRARSNCWSKTPTTTRPTSSTTTAAKSIRTSSVTNPNQICWRNPESKVSELNLSQRCHPEEGVSPPRDRTTSSSADAVEKIATPHAPEAIPSTPSNHSLT